MLCVILDDFMYAYSMCFACMCLWKTVNYSTDSNSSELTFISNEHIGIKWVNKLTPLGFWFVYSKQQTHFEEVNFVALFRRWQVLKEGKLTVTVYSVL